MIRTCLLPPLLLLAVLALGSASTAHADDDNAPAENEDARRLAGRWYLVENSPDPLPETCTGSWLEFDKDRVTSHSGDVEIRSRYRVVRIDGHVHLAVTIEDVTGNTTCDGQPATRVPRGTESKLGFAFDGEHLRLLPQPDDPDVYTVAARRPLAPPPAAASAAGSAPR